MKITMSLAQVNERPNLEQAKTRQQAMGLKKNVEAVALAVAWADGTRHDLNKDLGDSVVVSMPHGSYSSVTGQAKFTPPARAGFFKRMVGGGGWATADDIREAKVEVSSFGTTTVSKIERNTCGLSTFTQEYSNGTRKITQIDSKNDLLTYEETPGGTG